MQIRILIPTYERPDLLRRTLESLTRAHRPASLERIVVVENGSDAGARAICDGFAGRLPLDYRHNAHSGKGRSLQTLVEELGAGPILFLDDDVRVAPGLLPAYEAALRSFGPGHFFGGPLSVDYVREPAEWLKNALPNSAKGFDAGGALAPGETFLGANFAAFAEDILAAGGFDLRLGPGAHAPGTEPNPTGEERELQIRFLRKGYKPVCVPEARVWHWVPAERCSADWALHRAARKATSAVLRSPESQGDASFRFRGAPLGLWSSLARTAVRTLLARRTRDEERRFREQLGYQRVRGRIRGHQLLARSKR